MNLATVKHRRPAVSVLVSLVLLSTQGYSRANEPREGLLQQRNPTINYVQDVDFKIPVNPVPAGHALARVTPVDLGSSGAGWDNDSGCEAEDFAGFPPGDIALISRSPCQFRIKVLNAQDAGASGVLIANYEEGLVTPHLLDADVKVPVLLITKEVGDRFATLAATGLRVHMLVRRS